MRFGFIGLFIYCSTLLVNASNGIGVFTQGKVLEDIPLPLVGIQYERYIVPQVSGYIKYSGISASYNSTDCSFSSTAFGVRGDLILLTVGLGYESISADFSNSSTSASSKVGGVILEAGKRLSLGPVQFGLFYRMHMADISIKADAISEISIPVSEGTETLHALDASVSIFF